jgi:hypothetical protein
MKKTRKEERPKKLAKRDLDPMELCRVMAGLSSCDASSCFCSGDACACTS